MVGLGPNAIRTYIPFFCNHSIELLCVVEMESALDAVSEILSTYQIIAEIITVPEEYRNAKTLCQKTVSQLEHSIAEKGIEYVIINSEAKSHYAYLNFFLKKQLKILLEKPIIAPAKLYEYSDVDCLRRNYKTIRRIVDCEDEIYCGVMCQRRLHYGYTIVRQLLRDTILRYGIPITEIYINHCDGNWMLPQDLFYENHPYQYGYGKLYHSGYHFVDLLAQLLSLNRNVAKEKRAVSAVVSTDVLSVADEMAIINKDDLKRIFHTEVLPEISAKEKVDFEQFGEKNVYSQFAFRNSANRTVTVAQISITQIGFSRRAWQIAKKDHYKGNGRIRHEYVNIQVGPLMNIRVSSYQSKECHQRGDCEHLSGGLDHFDIEVFRNAQLIGGVPYQKFDYNDIMRGQKKSHLQGLNEIARERMLEAFFDDRILEVSDIRDHDFGMKLMLAMTEGIVDQKKGVKAIHTIDVKEDFM